MAARASGWKRRAAGEAGGRGSSAPHLMSVKHNVCRTQSGEQQRAAREIFRRPQELPGDSSGAYEPALGQTECR
jgi:hypothetical protein